MIVSPWNPIDEGIGAGEMLMSSRPVILSVLCGLLLTTNRFSWAGEPSKTFDLDNGTRDRCLRVLRQALASDEFWPSMHAAEALSLSGHAEDARRVLKTRIKTETDDQKRCGLARELVRSGDLSYVRVLSEVLAKPDPYGHTHAAESLFKVRQLGDASPLRSAMDRPGPSKLGVMACASLARWGDPAALEMLREYVHDEDGDIARDAAWVLARTGDARDLPALRSGAKRFDDPLTRAYFEHALAALGDQDGLQALLRNLSDPDPKIRVYAAEFAPEARAVDARERLIRLLDDPDLDVRVRVSEALLLLSKPEPPASSEDIRLDIFPATEANPRYSEGSVLTLRDGRLLYASTEFQGGHSDESKARIIAVSSDDEGRTWSDPRVLQENTGRQNVMSVTLRRLSANACFDGPIGLFYLVKNGDDDLQVRLRISDDEAATFGDPVQVTTEPGYHVLNNDRITLLSSGRIIVPVATIKNIRSNGPFESLCYLSDDGGHSWRKGLGGVSYPKRGAMEPEVLELPDNRLLMHFRTQMGHIAVSGSADGGETWSEPHSWGVRAPEAPATLRRIPSTGDLLLIWNDTFRAGEGHGGKRTPLTSAVSTNEGRTWTHKRDLETDTQHTYAYTSLLFDRGRAVMTYWVRDEKTGRISSRFRSVPVGWFYETEGCP